MATVKVFNIEDLVINTAEVGLASPSRLVVEELSGGADHDHGLALDDLLVVLLNQGGVEKCFFKGFVYKSDHDLRSDITTYSAIGIEDIVEAAPWEAQIKNYNTDKEPCDGSLLRDATIQEALLTENTGVVANWFDNIVIPLSIANLPAGPVESYQKGFFTWLSDLLKPYPFIAWRIDYSYSDVAPNYPLGNLVLLDMTVGDSLHVVSIGDKVSNLAITQDISKAAENLRVWGRGDFEEVYEVLQADWEDELVPFGPKKLLLPSLDRPEEPSNVYLNHDFIDSLDIKFQTHPNPDGVTLPIQAWEGSDYTVDKVHGRITWNPQNYWILDSTGEIQYTVSSPGTGWRRPVAYQNNHVRELSSATLSYEFMHPDAFRKYKTSAPIAAFRIYNKTVANPEAPPATIDQTLEADEFVNAYKPIFNPTGVYDSDPPADGFWKVPEARAGSIAAYVGHNTDTFDPATYTIMTDFVLQPTITEGTACVYFAERQLLPINAYFKHPDAPNLRLVSWDIVLYYTKWLNLLEARGGNPGAEKYANFVYDNLYTYVNVFGDTLIDLSSVLTDVANKLQAYLAIAVPSGQMTYAVELTGTPTKQWDIPFNVGDKVTFDGEVGAGGVYDTVQLIVNKIDYKNIDKGLISVSFGAFEPKDSIFIARASLPTDMVNTGIERLDISTLEERR